MSVAGRDPDRPPVRKRFGQHFLEPAWVAKVVAAIAPRAEDLFLEIGPGRGQLTLPLATTGARVLAIEVDRDLATALQRRGVPGVEVVSGDFLEQDLGQRLSQGAAPARPARVVGNLPYNLSSPILFRLLDQQRVHGRFVDATLMLQREVADRVVGQPGTRAYGPLAIMTQVAADARLVLRLPPGAFRPPPRVHSALVRLTFRPAPVEIVDLPLFGRMVRSLFSRRRKMLLNAFSPFAATVSPRPAPELVRQAGLDPRCRAETLRLDALAALAATLTTS